jgi:hypothetical protein
MSYLQFDEYDSPTKKTKVVNVVNARDGTILGQIKWWGAWRKYCFFLSFGYLVFDSGCLQEIIEEMNRLMKEREDAKKENRISSES